jgi:hypothetical protein
MAARPTYLRTSSFEPSDAQLLENADDITWCMDRFYASYEKDVTNLSYLLK